MKWEWNGKADNRQSLSLEKKGWPGRGAETAPLPLWGPMRFPRGPKHVVSLPILKDNPVPPWSLLPCTPGDATQISSQLLL